MLWSNGLAGTITTLAIIMLLWPLADSLWERYRNPASRQTESLNRSA